VPSGQLSLRAATGHYVRVSALGFFAPCYRAAAPVSELGDEFGEALLVVLALPVILAEQHRHVCRPSIAVAGQGLVLVVRRSRWMRSSHAGLEDAYPAEDVIGSKPRKAGRIGAALRHLAFAQGCPSLRVSPNS
jgi:hypothetical protein